MSSSLPEPRLRAFGLRHAFGRRRALDGVELELRPGEKLAIVGPSGSGKSTLARVLAGHLRPDEGRVELEGRALVRADRRRVQLVAQDPGAALDPRLVADRALATVLPARADREACLAALGLPPAVLGRRPAELSGGQKQRLVVARALAVSPAVLILDEPTSALDRASARRLLELVDGAGAVDEILVTHDLALAADQAHRLLVLDGGRVVEEGAISTVLAAPRHPVTRGLVSAAQALGWEP